VSKDGKSVPSNPPNQVYIWDSPRNYNLVKGETYYIVVKATQNGRSLYSNTNGFIVGEGGVSGSDDDDSGFPAYKAGLIAMGIAIYCLLLLLLLLILIACAAGKKEDKYTTTVHRNENVEKV